VLYSQVVVDKAQLARHIRHALQDARRSPCASWCETRNRSSMGLAELVAYLQLGDEYLQGGGRRDGKRGHQLARHRCGW
jgi:hypothetical protein